jgi:hypothetical protein
MPGLEISNKYNKTKVLSESIGIFDEHKKLLICLQPVQGAGKNRMFNSG